MDGRANTRFSLRRTGALLKNLGVALGVLAMATAVCLLLGKIDDVDHGDAYVSMVYILAVLLISRLTDGYAWGIIASLTGVLAVNFFFTYPYFAFNFSLPGYPITIACMLTVSILTSALTTRIRREEQTRREADREKIRSNLLRAISHDLRTPLTSILGVNSALMENGDKLSYAQRMQLHAEINDDAQWLIRMVENLLTITRIRQNETNQIVKTPEAAEEVIAETLGKFSKRYTDCAISVHAPEELLVCPMDAMLIEQVLLNLLENAVQHAAGMTKIELSAVRNGDEAVFSVADDGCGVPKEKLAQLFEDSGRSGGDDRRNMGIGLSVCSAIIRAHGGAMHAGNRAGGGLEISFTLPMGGEGA